MDNITKLAAAVVRRNQATGLASIIKIAMKKVAATKAEQIQLQQQPWRNQSFVQAYDNRVANPQAYQDAVTHGQEMAAKPQTVGAAKRDIAATGNAALNSQIQDPDARGMIQQQAHNKITNYQQNAAMNPQQSSVDANFLRQSRATNKNFTDNLQKTHNQLKQQVAMQGTGQGLARWRDNTASNIAMNFGAKGVSGVDWHKTQENLGVGPGQGFIPMLQGNAKKMLDQDKADRAARPMPGMPLAQDIGKFLSEQGSWGKKAVDFTKGLYNTVAPHAQKAWNYFTSPQRSASNFGGHSLAYGAM